MSSPPASVAARALHALVRVIWRTSIDAFRRHAVFAIFLGFMAAYTAKSVWYGDFFNPHRHPGIVEVPFLEFLTADLLFFGAAILSAVLVENLVPHWAARVLTIPLALLVAAASLVNGFWLAHTGVQFNYSVLKAALQRFGDAAPIIVKSVQVWGFGLLFSSVAAALALPFLFRARWTKEAPHDRGDRWCALYLAGVLLALGGLGVMLGDARMLGWRGHASNLFVALLRDLRDPLQSSPKAALPAAPAELLAPGQPRLEKRPNVVMVMLEALSYGASSFGDPRSDRTPTLMALAARGLSTRSMRSVLPHTTKSIFSFVCGRYPAMQNAPVEVADNFGMRCLPHLLKEQGYESALMQSAAGGFEDRPRLAANMGFDEFLAWPQTGTPMLGYLASDDRGLVRPALAWTTTRPGPFFLLLVTSITHHPYVPPRDHAAYATVRKRESQERYLWLARYLDSFLAELLEGLRAAGRLDNTIVLAFGDHGEGFGEHGIYQHDNTFFEEGLHVPLVIFAPGQITRPVVVEEERSLLDVPPTVLELVGLRYQEKAFDGLSLLRPAPGVRRYFGCWYDNTCVGYVERGQKLAFFPGERSWARFDLSADPMERDPLMDRPEDRPAAEDLARWLAAHRYSPARARMSRRELFGKQWLCPHGARCEHAGEPR